MQILPYLAHIGHKILFFRSRMHGNCGLVQAREQDLPDA
jgi:hypothetical protein